MTPALETLWASDDLLSTQYATCIENRGLIYGIHGRDDAGRASLRLIDPEQQKVLLAKGRLRICNAAKSRRQDPGPKDPDGTLVLLRCDPARYVELASAQVFTTKTFALPALSSGRLYGATTTRSSASTCGDDADHG